MTDYIVDTSVLSLFAPGRETIGEPFASWAVRHESSLYLPTIVLAEIEQGISKLYRQGSLMKATQIATWRTEMIRRFSARFIDFSLPIALRAGQISDDLRGKGVFPGLADVMIAATAQEMDANVLTRNLRHFEAINVVCLDPFDPDFILQTNRLS